MTLLASACSSKTTGSPAAAAIPTYAKDVAPILQKSCEVCHRPGEAGPFSLLTYADARPRAREIKSSILSRKMPPWYADPHYGKFSNTMNLSAAEIDTVRSVRLF